MVNLQNLTPYKVTIDTKHRIMMKKLLLIAMALLTMASAAIAARPTGRQIVRDYCRLLPKDIPLNKMMFKDLDSRRIIRLFLDRQQDAFSADTVYVITISKISPSEYVSILRGDSILRFKSSIRLNNKDEELRILKASQCSRNQIFVDEYLRGLQRIDFSRIDCLDNEIEVRVYQVVRMIYSNGRLVSYDVGYHNECDIWKEYTPLDYKPIAYPENKRWPRIKIIMK